MNETLVVLLMVAIAAQSIVLCVILLRLMPLVRELEGLMRKAQQTLGRFDAMAGQLSDAAGGVREIERRFRGIANAVMDEVEPVTRRLVTLATGVRAGLRVLTRREANGVNGPPSQHPAEERGVR
jgi:hypothetical protein